MKKEKRKRSSRQHIPTLVYILMGILILLGTCIVGFGIGVEMNNDELEGLTLTQMTILEATQQAIETQWEDLQITRTAIAEIEATMTNTG